ncbi:MAG: DNA mismatch endonuclease Vsr [Rhodobacteraceae bacterium]|jgi:DNA mismatch endonuclease (patch repair protein)|nr:DNA mismatch endonuclease Vsr [Paracoccaceae bacterium]MBL4556641.1 DNA mismatch endonuclease Vsr [Paracoccaceae bacterium]
MAAIRDRDTKPERIVRSGLHARGLRFRLHRKGLPGRPDLVLPRWRVALFVNGCFWHAHRGCRYFQLPSTNTDVWQKKLEGNRARDERDQAALRELGWHVVVVWECRIRDRRPEDVERVLDELAAMIRDFDGSCTDDATC